MNIDFSKYPDGLVPAIVQDAQTKTVLMLGYMNADAVAKTASQQVTFFTAEVKTACGPKARKAGMCWNWYPWLWIATATLYLYKPRQKDPPVTKEAIPAGTKKTALLMDFYQLWRPSLLTAKSTQPIKVM